MDGSAIDQEVSRICRITKSIGDAAKTNNSWVGKIKCTSLGNQQNKHDAVDEEVMKELMKICEERMEEKEEKDVSRMDKGQVLLALNILCYLFSKTTTSTTKAAAAPSPNIPPPKAAVSTSQTTPKTPPPPPPSLAKGKNIGPPLPPPPIGARTLLTKKSNTKLKRSAQISNLNRCLREKLEASNNSGVDGSGKSGNGGKRTRVGVKSGNSKQGQSEYIAEMTKRSGYFQQIEKDVQTYGKSITELKTKIGSFQNTDMTELLKFRNQVESCLEKLTDESQVLKRFEGFPVKKLESLRMAAALYSKLETIIAKLQSWKITPPFLKLVDQINTYFTKMKLEVDAVERVKEEEMKKFQAQKIYFDPNVIVKLKESMVDLSSSCIDLALKDIREAKATDVAQKRVTAKMLWKVFQLAFRTYSFAGGQDDRAERLTRELAHEIESML